MPIRLSIKKAWNKTYGLQLLIIIFISLIPFASLSQSFVLKGKIIDAKTFEALPYVNIAVQGTTLGTMSDIRGEFSFKLPESKVYKISISSVGYNAQTFIASKDTSVSVLLNPTTMELEEITVKPDDTANTLVRKVIENRPQFSVDKCSAQEYEMYTKAMVTFRKFNFKKDSSLNTRFFKKEFERFSILSEDDKVPGLPGYMIESLSKVYTLKSPQRVRRDVLSMNMEGTVFNQTEMLDELINKQLDLNLYENQVQLFGKTFISPLANGAKAFYKYSLVDTLEIEGERCLEIYFFPKQKGNLCFSGSMWIVDSLYIPKRMSARTSLQTDINYIDAISIHQDFDLKDSKSAPSELRIGITGLNLLIDVLSVKDNYVLSVPRNTDFYSEEMPAGEKVENKTRLFEKREAYFSDYDQIALENLNKLSESGKIRTFSKLIETSITGFYKTKYLDYGPWLLLASSNEIEGTRLRLGANTTLAFSPKFHLDGYLAYGFGDQKWKGAFNTSFFFNKNRWGLIGFRYGNDLANIGSANPFEQQDAFFALSTAINSAVDVNRVELKSLYGQVDVFQNFTLKTAFTQADYSPVGEKFVFAWYDNETKTNLASDFATTEIDASLSYHPGNNYIVDGNRRFLAGNNSSPVLVVGYTKGLKDVFGGDFDYDKLKFSLEQKVFTSGFGYLHYLAAYEQTFGQAVYPLLNVLPGNESIWRSWTQFNLIDKGTIVADKLISARAEWHFEGSITRKLPLIKWLDVRLLAGGNLALGSFDESKNGFYDPVSNPGGILSATDAGGLPSSSFQPLQFDKPYSEVFFGVENIFKIFRADFIFRANSFYENYASEFGIKISGRFGL